MLVGFSGKKRSGKDTAADFLVQAHKFTKIGFKDPVYDVLYALNPIIIATNSMTKRVQDVVDWHGWEKAKDMYPEIRKLQQRLGMEGFRAIDENLLVQILAKKGGPLTRVVVPDVRFPNEAEFIQDSGGILIRIERNGVDLNDVYPTEISMDDWKSFDHIIHNNGTTEQLYEMVRQVVFG